MGREREMRPGKKAERGGGGELVDRLRRRAERERREREKNQRGPVANPRAVLTGGQQV